MAQSTAICTGQRTSLVGPKANSQPGSFSYDDGQPDKSDKHLRFFGQSSKADVHAKLDDPGGYRSCISPIPRRVVDIGIEAGPSMTIEGI